MNKKNNLNNINSILDSVKNNLGLNKALKQQEFVKLWSKIVGSRFQNSSKVAYLYNKHGYDYLIIAVSSPVVSQELSFHKNVILEKIKVVAKDFNYNIKEIFFDPKLWEELKKEKNRSLKEEKEKKLYKLEKSFSEEELEKIELPQGVAEDILKSLNEQNFHSRELKENLFKTIIKDLKKHEWKKKNGFPLCSVCGIPVNYYTAEKENLCPVCKYQG